MWLYRVNYMYYTIIAIVNCLVIGILVSLVTGKDAILL